MKRLSRLIGVLLFVIPLGAAEDFTGKWAGAFVSTRSDGSPDNEKIYMDVKQNGNEITGTAGPTETDQSPLKGTVDGNKVAFDVRAEEGRLIIKFALVFSDGHLKGDAVAEVQGQKMTAKIDMERKSK